MEKILFKFMRAKYNKAVKAGKVRGEIAEYINYGDWRLEISFSFETVKVITPTNNIVDSLELFEAVLDAILSGDTSYLDKLVNAVRVADKKSVKLAGAEGDLKITDAYFRADGTIGVWVQLYSKEFERGYRRSTTSISYDKFIKTMERAGVI